MCFPATQRPFEVDDVCELVRKVYGNQVHFVDGDEELVPGLSVHKNRRSFCWVNVCPSLDTKGLGCCGI